ncbi:hypothetical protein [uncultured Winogradskyella sp.]|uniref:hypothetical protein n=1 Tax=uncultured Winogradskyella sp. TaxID=395353 RepID=UPI00262C9673|nr:hypothetical protein [uncultured Winogradskyella sp.]
MNKIILTILLSIFVTTNSVACTCIVINESLSKKVIKSFNQSDFILTGKVISKEDKRSSDKSQSSFDPIIYRFEIKNIIKGNINTRIVAIASPRDGSSCGYSFEIGKSYLVYGRESEQFSSITKNKLDFVSSLCDRNQKLKIVKKRELRKLKRLAKQNLKK